MEGVTPQQLLETPDLIAVGVAGDEVRRRIHGAKTTFVRVFEVHVDAPLTALPPRVSAGEFRIVGRPDTLEAAVAAVRATVAIAGGVPVTMSSVSDLQAIPEGLSESCEALRAAGLAGVVQLPIDLLPDAEGAVRAIRDAGLTLLTMTVETLGEAERVAICERARALQETVGGFKAFAPLPRRISVAQPTTGYDDVKQVALARVMVPNVPSIQVDWALYGPKLAQVALTVGADDVDNVAAVDPGILGTRRSPLEEIKGNINAAFLEPLERDAMFNHL
jgi:aminodeoxyfutalosine synthase